MAQISGKYVLVKNENLAAYLKAIGVPDEKAEKADALRPTLEVVVDGQTVALNSDSGVENSSSTYVLNEEIDEMMPLGFKLKSTATLDADTLTIQSKEPQGRMGSRVYKFTADGVVLTITNTDSPMAPAKRFYKKC